MVPENKIHKYDSVPKISSKLGSYKVGYPERKPE